jgi:hypothetical protein
MLVYVAAHRAGISIIGKVVTADGHLRPLWGASPVLIFELQQQK